MWTSVSPWFLAPKTRPLKGKIEALLQMMVTQLKAGPYTRPLFSST